MRDMATTGAVLSAIDPGTDSAEPAEHIIDRTGFDALTFVLSLGAGGIVFTDANRIDVLLEHSDDGVAFDPVGPSNVVGGTTDINGVVLSQRTAHPTPSVLRIGYVDGTIGDRRYVRLRTEFIGTHGTGTPLSAVAWLDEASFDPVGTLVA